MSKLLNKHKVYLIVVKINLAYSIFLLLIIKLYIFEFSVKTNNQYYLYITEPLFIVIINYYDRDISIKLRTMIYY